MMLTFLASFPIIIFHLPCPSAIIPATHAEEIFRMRVARNYTMAQEFALRERRGHFESKCPSLFAVALTPLSASSMDTMR